MHILPWPSILTLIVWDNSIAKKGSMVEMVLSQVKVHIALVQIREVLQIDKIPVWKKIRIETYSLIDQVGSKQHINRDCKS
jgi:hypothetical protein